MDVRIGVTDTAKEIEVDLGDDVAADKVKKEIEGVLNGATPILWLTDKKGRTVGVPSAKVAYVEMGAESSERRVGFTTH